MLLRNIILAIVKISKSIIPSFEVLTFSFYKTQSPFFTPLRLLPRSWHLSFVYFRCELSTGSGAEG